MKFVSQDGMVVRNERNFLSLFQNLLNEPYLFLKKLYKTTTSIVTR